MAAELVAGALLGAVFDQLFERLASLEDSTDFKLKQLVSKLTTARLYLDDAENRQLRDTSIKEWLDNLKHVVFLADDFSDEIHDSQNRHLVGEIGEIMTELDILLDRAIVLGLKHSNGTARDGGSSSMTNPAPLREEHHVFGRKEDRDKMLGLLLSNEAFGSQQIGVVPIVGMGGVGKTTLAQLVYHDTTRLMEAEFIHKAWVTVSTDFNVVKILKSILQKIIPGDAGNETGELSQLQHKMRDALTGRKFLIVLDDIWDENYSNWNLLKRNFESGALGSRVVVTTRSEKVGNMVKTGPIHELRGVSSEDCWSIFIDHAFSAGDSDSYQQFHKIGRKIVKKCDGLPLAVMAMGGLLCSTRDTREWENVLNSPVWECGESNQINEVVPSLWLSYRCLPSTLKQCFAYCSVFPQDHEFDKEQMVLLWMAEGFLPCGKTETRSMEEFGGQYFDNLVSRSLFQRSRRDKSKFVMHDLIHDLAAFVSGKFCVSVTKEDVELKRVTVWTRHLSHGYVALDSKLLSGVSTAKHLRSFLSQQKYGKFCDNEFVKQLSTNHRRLRALTIHTTDPICNLKHLRFLNLSYCHIKEVPSSVCTLFNLQTLILSYCRALTRLPTDITKLIKLRHLDISGSEHIEHMPPRIGKLKELRTLSHFIVGDPDVSACSNINEMQELQHLSGKLSISGLENAAKFQDVGKDILRHKVNLKELVLKWADTSISRSEDKAVLDALQPHTNLERLVIEGYQALIFPTWVGEMSYDKLVSVELDGRFCESFPPFWQLPSLSKLAIKGFAKLEKMAFEFYGDDSPTSRFQCLETLEIGMISLKELILVDKTFPCLKKLIIVGCEDLPASSIDCKMVEEFEISGNSCLESFPLDKFPMLRKLSLKSCSNLKSLTNDGNSESLASSLTHLQIDRCSKLVAPDTRLDMKNLTSLVSLTIWNCECESAASSMSSELFAQVWLPSSLAYLELWDVKGYKSLNGSAFQQAKSLKKLFISGCYYLESLPEKELLSSVSTLRIFNCHFLERKYSKRKGDQSYQHISHIPHLAINGATTFYDGLCL